MEKTGGVILMSLKDRVAQLMSVGLRVDLARVSQHFKRNDVGYQLAVYRIAQSRRQAIIQGSLHWYIVTTSKTFIPRV